MKLFLDWLTLKNLKIGQKLAVVTLPLLLPLGVLLWIVVQRSAADAGSSHKELQGVEYARPLRALMRHVLQHRVLAARTLTGVGSARGDLEAAAAQADGDAVMVDALDAKYGADFRTKERWQSIRTRWQALKTGVLAMKPEVSREEHDGLIEDLIALISDVQASSDLLLDPDADPHFLQEALLVALPRGAAEADRLRAQADVAVAAARKDGAPPASRTLSADDRAQFAASIARTTASADGLGHDLAGAFRDSPGRRSQLDGLYQQQAAAWRALLDGLSARLLAAKEIDAGAADVQDLAARTVDADFALADAIDADLTELLKARLDGVYRTAGFALAGIVGGLALVVGAACLTLRTITRQVGDIRDLFARISVGEFGARARVSSDDELGRTAASLNAMLDNTVALIQSREERDAIQEAIHKLLEEISGVAEGDLTKNAQATAGVTGPIAESFNFMIGQLRGIIGNVQQATRQVGDASTQIHAAAEQLVRGTEVQTRRITQTFRSVEEMAKSVQEVAATSDQGAEVAGQALASARRGAAAVDDTITGMGRIRERVQETGRRIRRLADSSRQIGEIVQLIDDVADRTSILALNASIQAAAAGEAGRGFAVVAEEVERLAERSAAATRRIGGLVRAIQGETGDAAAAMEESTREVVEGSRVANQAGQALTEIGAVSHKLAALIQSISEAAGRQAAASRGITLTMGEVSEITQQTAAGARRDATAVSRLARLAEDLRASVSAFRLPAENGPAEPAAPSRSAAGRNGESTPSADAPVLATV